MLPHAICHRFGRVARFACATLLLLLADHAKTDAGTLHHLGHEADPTASTLACFTASDENRAHHLPMDAQDMGSPVAKTASAVGTFGNRGTVSAPAARTVADEPPSHTALAGPDWNGVWLDTGILFGAQIVAAGLIFAMPESVSGWDEEEKKNGFKNYAKNARRPRFDTDDFYINYILHPYWGATYYIRGRERGLEEAPSFVYSALISAMYEFGIECFFEKPSIQDLIVTPVAGSLLGAFVFEPFRASIKRKQELRWYDEAMLIATDPVGVLSSGFENLFGIKPVVRLDYQAPQLQKRYTGSAVASKSHRIGVTLRFSLN